MSNIPFFQQIESVRPDKTVEIPINNYGKIIFLEHFGYVHEKENKMYPKNFRVRFYKISDLTPKKAGRRNILGKNLIVEAERYDNIEGSCRYSVVDDLNASGKQYFTNNCRQVNYIFMVEEQGKYQLDLTSINQGENSNMPFVGIDNYFNIVNTNPNNQTGPRINSAGIYKLTPGIHRIFTAVPSGEQLGQESLGIDYFELTKL